MRLDVVKAERENEGRESVRNRGTEQIEEEKRREELGVEEEEEKYEGSDTVKSAC